FTHKIDNDLLVCQIYVDDIIFGSTNMAFCEDFSKIMTKRFEMSMMGELKYFLGFKSSNSRKEPSCVKPSTSPTCSRSLTWKVPSPSRPQWLQLDTSTSTKKVNRWIKRYIDP